MKLSDEQIAQIEDYAYSLTPIGDIALLLGIGTSELKEQIFDEYNAAHAAYYRGKARILLEIRRNELTLAQAGSPQAMQLVNEYIYKMNSEE